MSRATMEASAQAMDMSQLRKRMSELTSELKVVRAEIDRRGAKPEADNEPKDYRSATTDQLVSMRMDAQITRMGTSQGTPEHYEATVVMALIEQELTLRSQEAVQYVGPRAYLFVDGTSYWGDEALLKFSGVSQ